MIEVRRVSGTQLDGVSLFRISSTQLVGVSLYVVFYDGVCKRVYARSEKEAIEKVKASIENS